VNKKDVAMPFEISLFDFFAVLMKLIFYAIAICSITLSWVGYRRYKNFGFILVGLFFCFDILGQAHVSIRKLFKQKEKYVTQYIQPATDTVHTSNINFPLGELLLLVALYKLTDDKKAFKT
jgi:hypothetical protein